jgi:glycosyltransferase involved in cell wall biosynthesis
MSAVRTVRVAHIISNLETGGAEIALERLVNGLDSRFVSAVWSLRNIGTVGTRLRAHGTNVNAAGLAPNARLMRRWWVLAKQIREFRPDAIQGWMYHGNLAAALIHGSLARGPRLLWNVRGSLKATHREKATTRCFMGLTRFLAGRPECIINNSVSSVHDHIAYGYPSDRWRVIPNGFDSERFRPRHGELQSLRSSLGFPTGSGPIIGAVGRNHPVKGHDFFVKAVCELVRRGHKVVGVLVGPGWEPRSSAARSLSEEYGGLFRCLGETSEVERVLAALDVLCLPSLSEGFPNVVAEAMSCAVPCVATDVGDAREIVGDTGEIATPGDAVALADALERLLALDPESRRRKGAAARRRVQELYSTERMVQAYEQLYENAAVDGGVVVAQ